MQPIEVWKPPVGYQAVESKVPGILVYAPVPENKPADETPLNYKCPHCGAATRFDVAAGGVVCEHCGYSLQAKAEQVGDRAEKSEFTLETLRKAEQGWGVDRRVIHCDNCGAELYIAEGALTTTCAFCASNKVNLRAASADVLRPRFLIPFKIQNKEIAEKARLWLGQGWFHPDDLKAQAVIDRFSGIYLPFWTFGARVDSDWKAEVGHETTERYYDSQDKEWKTRSVVHWRWQDGRVSTNIQDLLISASSHVSHLLLERLYPFQLVDLVTYDPDYLAGWQALTYDITLPNAWEEGKAAMRERAKEACYADISSAHIRNFSMSADFGDESWRYVLLPVYLASYCFDNRVYQVLVNGQSGIVAGQKPVAWWKVWLAIGALFSPGVILGLIGLILLAVGIGVVPLIIGFVLTIIAGIISYNIYKSAAASEAA